MLSGPRNLSRGLTLAVVLMFPEGAHALESPWTDTGKAQVRLLAAGAPADTTTPLRAGVEIRLARGWHTYWRYPGDAGVPPRFEFSASTNVASVEVHWPAPQRIAADGGLQSIGYEGDVVFPVRIRAADPAKPVTLRLKLDFGVCEKICIPAEARATLAIPPGLSVTQPALDAADARVPATTVIGQDKVFGVLAAKLERGKQPRALIEVAVPPGRPFDLFAEGPSDDWALPLPHRIAATDGRARFVVSIEGAPAGGSPTPAKLRLTLVSGDKAIEAIVPLD